MTDIWSAQFDRTRLGLEPLVISCNPFGTRFHLDENDATWPSFTAEVRDASSAADLDGLEPLGTRRGRGMVNFAVYAHEPTTAELIEAWDELEAATFQLKYDLTLTWDGISRTYPAISSLPEWGVLDSGMIKGKVMRAGLVIPLNPPVSA